MRRFNYTGNGMLAFTHHDTDYVIHNQGPHELPEDSEIVKSLTAQKLLIQVQAPELTIQQIDLKSKKIR
jgi:hypothetical protein